MDTNQPSEEIIDPELERAKKSMGNRIDPDDEPEESKPKEEEKPEEKKEPEKTPENEPDDQKPEDKKPEDVTPTDDQQKAPQRPERYIPMPKYLSERDQWKKDADALATAKARIQELESISTQNEGTQKDEDIEAFMAETGFDRATVDGFLKLAENRLLKPERIKAIETAEAIVRESEMEAHFNKEFSSVGEPELVKRFPEATPAQLAEAKKYIDQVAHSKDYHDKPLDFVIYKHGDEISKLFAAEPEAPAPQTKRPMESSRVGAGKPNALTAKDFADKGDFSLLETMDQAQRSALIKEFDSKTYQSWMQWAKAQEAEKGMEVTRGGRKIILK